MQQFYNNNNYKYSYNMDSTNPLQLGRYCKSDHPNNALSIHKRCHDGNHMDWVLLEGISSNHNSYNAY